MTLGRIKATPSGESRYKTTLLVFPLGVYCLVEEVTVALTCEGFVVTLGRATVTPSAGFPFLFVA